MNGQGALDGYFSRDPARWTGLGRLSEADLAVTYPLNEGEGRATRGEMRRRYRVRTLDRSGFAQPFFLFFDDDDGLVILETDYWSLDADTSARLIEALGPPPDKLDAVFRMGVISGGEWVYPGRGLALCIMPESRLVVRWTAFAPTTIKDYRLNIRAADSATEFETETG